MPNLRYPQECALHPSIQYYRRLGPASLGLVRLVFLPRKIHPEVRACEPRHLGVIAQVTQPRPVWVTCSHGAEGRGRTNRLPTPFRLRIVTDCMRPVARGLSDLHRSRVSGAHLSIRPALFDGQRSRQPGEETRLTPKPQSTCLHAGPDTLPAIYPRPRVRQRGVQTVATLVGCPSLATPRC